MPTDRSSLQALKNMLEEIDLLISTTVPLPENRTPRCLELLRTSQALTADLVKQARMPAASAMGHIGGSATASRYGSEHFRALAGKRKVRAGGRPRKQTE
jgi:hypothetical protein